jgi:hypothetical protein
MILEEYSYAVLKRDLPELGLVAGDVGVVVMIHTDLQEQPIGYALELFSIGGESLDVVSVGLDDVRPSSDNDRTHARSAA